LRGDLEVLAVAHAAGDVGEDFPVGFEALGGVDGLFGQAASPFGIA